MIQPMRAPAFDAKPSPRDAADAIADFGAHCLRLEVRTWPKPGLVSHVDQGSHDDMDVDTFARSATAIRPFLAQLARAGAARETMAALRRIGLRAEHAMLAATGGVNTHRGAIFGLGLLCAAAGLRAAGDPVSALTLGACVAAQWGDEILGGPRSSDSHGERAIRRYGVGGARGEAANGFPAVYAIGLPALRAARALRPGDAEAARVQACFALIAALDDTNLLHRGGAAGLAFAQQAARDFLAHGGVGADDWRARAAAVHRAFVARRLSPGGTADLLAMSLFADGLDPQ